uniref:HIT-type domain-containing protein n=1 Tax=Steinernema glaseri TaxID=37863 RepID=A0A1I7YUI6_9BILA
MTDIKSSPLYSNDSLADKDYGSWDLPIADRRFNYSVLEKGCLVGTTSIGVLCGSMPLMIFMNRYGPYPTVILVGTATTVVAALAPLAASYGTGFLIAIRFAQGMCFSNIFPVIGAILTRWAALSESGLFLSLLTGYIQLSTIVSAPIAGVVGKEFGWPAIYYVHAAMAAVLTVVWAFFFRNNPAKHPFVGAKEVQKISRGKSSTASTKKASNLILKFATGIISDRIHFLSERNKCRLFNSLAFYGGAFFFVVAAVVHPEDKYLCAFLAMAPQIEAHNHCSQHIQKNTLVLGCELRVLSVEGSIGGQVLHAEPCDHTEDGRICRGWLLSRLRVCVSCLVCRDGDRTSASCFLKFPERTVTQYANMHKPRQCRKMPTQYEDMEDESTPEKGSPDNMTPKVIRRKQLQALVSKTRFRKNFDQLLEENKGASIYEKANLPPSEVPPRKFCTGCGHFANYNCLTCGTGYCSITCRDRHQKTRCMKHTV